MRAGPNISFSTHQPKTSQHMSRVRLRSLQSQLPILISELQTTEGSSSVSFVLTNRKLGQNLNTLLTVILCNTHYLLMLYIFVRRHCVADIKALL